MNKAKSEMTPEELERREEEEFNTGPLSVLTQSIKNNTQVLINCRNNKKLHQRLSLGCRRVVPGQEHVSSHQCCFLGSCCSRLVQGYLNMAEKRTDAAKQESVDSVEAIDDLDNPDTPEMILLSAVSGKFISPNFLCRIYIIFFLLGEDAQDRSDRKILMPWVKFLWESYCQCLELLRTNVRVERLYHDIAQQAFRFCLKYQVTIISVVFSSVSVSIHTVRNLHFLSKNSTLISREKLSIFWG